jgi:hypothetical protein
MPVFIPWPPTQARDGSGDGGQSLNKIVVMMLFGRFFQTKAALPVL